jgi:hypothetical protein
LFPLILIKNKEKQMALYYDYVKILLASKGSFPSSASLYEVWLRRFFAICLVFKLSRSIDSAADFMLTKTRLALLVCDIPIPAVIRDHGEYPMVFDRLLRTSLPGGLDDFSMDSYDVRYAMEYPMGGALDTYDGIIITGSGEGPPRCWIEKLILDRPHLAASAYEGAEWINKLVSWVADVAKHRPRIKIIGVYDIDTAQATLELMHVQEYVSAIRSSRVLLVANVYRTMEHGRSQLPRSASPTLASASLAHQLLYATILFVSYS